MQTFPKASTTVKNSGCEECASGESEDLGCGWLLDNCSAFMVISKDSKSFCTHHQNRGCDGLTIDDAVLNHLEGKLSEGWLVGMVVKGFLSWMC